MKRLAHKTSLLFAAILIALMALPISALADEGAGGNEFTQTIDGYQITLSFEKPVFVGENQIHVLVKDAMNMPVPQADLEVSLVLAESEHDEEPAADTHTEESAETGSMSGMGGMDAQPTAEVGTMSAMSGMDAQPTPEIGVMSSMSSEPATMIKWAWLHSQPAMKAANMTVKSPSKKTEIKSSVCISRSLEN